MDAAKAMELLDKAQEHNYVYWHVQTDTITLDGEFTFEELEAVVWWSRNKCKKEKGE